MIFVKALKKKPFSLGTWKFGILLSTPRPSPQKNFRQIWGGHISPTAWLLNKLALNQYNMSWIAIHIISEWNGVGATVLLHPRLLVRHLYIIKFKKSTWICVSSVHPFVRSSVRSSVRPFVRSFVRSRLWYFLSPLDGAWVREPHHRGLPAG